MKLLLLLALSILSFTGCRKDKDFGPTCSRIRNSMIAHDVNGMKQAIQELFLTLPSTDYNKANMDLLVDRISGCDIDTGFYCFDCVQTLPSQTEIQFIIEHDGSTIKKTIDISYNNTDNTLLFVNMHD